MCGKKPFTANLQDKLIQVIKEICLGCQGDANLAKKYGLFIAQSLFMTITNANFDDKRFEIRIGEALKIRDSLPKGKIASAPLGVLSEKNEDLRSLREVITYGIKGIAAYVDHAAMLGYEDPEIYSFFVRALSAICKDLTLNELIALTLETGNYGVKAMALLDKANTTTYGKPKITKVNIGVGNRPGILVSGHDLRDLKELLEQSKDSGIDVYTHGEMLPAHYYPELKKYPHLFGNYGNAWWRQNEEFSKFNGPIVMTTNCITPINSKTSYRNRIFTTGPTGWPGVPHIADRIGKLPKDFSQVISLAKHCPAPTQIETGEIIGGFAHDQVFALADKIVEAVKAGHIKKFVIMGGCDGRDEQREYFTKVAENLPKEAVILTVGCAKYKYNKLNLGTIDGIPRVLDAGQCNDAYSLALIALKLKEIFGLDDVNKLPIAFDLGWYEQKATTVLLALLALGFKNIRLGPTIPAYLSPNVVGVLQKNFGIMGTTTVEDDIKAIMGNHE